MWLITLLLAIAGLIVNANGWFIIPSIVIKLLFGVSAVLVVIQLIVYRTVRKTQKKAFKNFDRL